MGGGKRKWGLFVFLALMVWQGQVWAKDLGGYWRFDEDSWSGAPGEVIDDSGQGNYGISVNGAYTVADGLLGRCGSLDGINDYIAIPSTADVEYTGGEFSISFWMKIDPMENDSGAIISKPWNGMGKYNYYIYYSADRQLRFSLHGATSWGCGSGVYLESGVWYQIAITVGSDRTVKIYVNGLEELSITHNITDWTAIPYGDENMPLCIGTSYPYGSGWAGSSGMSMKGELDDFGIWRRTLSTDEVSDLWNDGAGRPACAVAEGLLVEPFDTDTDNFAADYPQYSFEKYGWNGTASVDNRQLILTPVNGGTIYVRKYGSFSADSTISADLKWTGAATGTGLVGFVLYSPQILFRIYYNGSQMVMLCGGDYVYTGFPLPPENGLFHLEVKGDGSGSGFAVTLTDATNPDSRCTYNYTLPGGAIPLRCVTMAGLYFSGGQNEPAIFDNWKVVPGWRSSPNLPEGPVFGEPNEEFFGPFDSWIDVNEYGANGSDGNDDTAAIQRALDQLPNLFSNPPSSYRSMVYFPAGIYYINDTLDIATRMWVGIVGEDPETTKIKWAGGDGGGTVPMLWLNGVQHSRVGRITFDGSGLNVVGVADKWNHATTPQFANSANYYSDLFFQDMAIGLQFGGPGDYGNGGDSMTVLRCRFYRCGQAGIRTGSYNAFQSSVWDCVFVHNAAGIDDYAGGGACNVYRSYFQNSSVADIHVWSSFWRTLYGNTSVGSKKFFHNSGGAQTGISTIFQDNKILDSGDDTTIQFDQLGLAFLLDNRIRSLAGTTGPVVNMGGANGPDLASVNNRYTGGPNPIWVHGLSNNRFWSQGDQVIEETDINNDIPDIPGVPVNTDRVLYDLAATDTSFQIQAKINSAAANPGQRSLVHIPAGTHYIHQTITVPANTDLVIAGDCGGTKLVWADVSSSGPIMRLAGPSKTTVSNILFYGNGSTGTGIYPDAILIDDPDQEGARVYLDGVRSRGSMQAGLLINGCADTIIEGRNVVAAGVSWGPGLANSDFRCVKVAGTGGEGSGYTALFNPSFCNWAANGTILEAADGAHFLARDLYTEDCSPRLINLTGDSSVTLASGRWNSNKDVVPVIELDDFTGTAAFINFYLYMSDNINRKITVNDSAGANVLFLGMNGLLPSGYDEFFDRTGSGGEVSFLNGKYAWPNGGWYQTDDYQGGPRPGDAGFGTFLDIMLEQVRAEKPVGPTGTGPGITDVRIINVDVSGNENGTLTGVAVRID